MSNRYIVRQPIRNGDDEILGYEMVYHGDNSAFSSDGEAVKEYAAADAVSSLLNKNSVKALDGFTTFMTFNTILLMKKIPRLFDPSKLVIQINDSVVIHPLSMHFVHMFAKNGYKIAANEFEFTTRYIALMDSIDYLCVDVRPLSEPVLRNFIDVAKGLQKKCIVTHIENHKKYIMAQSLGADGYEGSYVTDRVQLQPKNKRFLKSQFFKLLFEATRDVPDITHVESLIAEDPILSYGLLKIVNSQYFALRTHPSTVHQALTAIGSGQLKQWVYLMCVDPSKPEENKGIEEFLRLSLMRASFYRELMRFSDDIPLSIAEGYLVGMLSTLPMLIDLPMGELLNELEMPSIFKKALEYKEGSTGDLYQLMLSYEQADWKAVEAYGDKLGISSQDVSQAYISCLEEVSSMWRKLNTPFVTEEK